MAGGSGLECYALDSSGRLVFSSVLSDAFMNATAATIDDSRYGFLCLKVDAVANEYEPYRNVERRLYYRIADKYIELLRADDGNGKCVMGSKNHFAGSRSIAPDWSDWQRLLESSDRVKQLRGLAVYFGVGEWYSATVPWSKPLDNSVRHRLEELANSPDPWISEEAKLALEEGKKK
jgi:hypothetical protein